MTSIRRLQKEDYFKGCLQLLEQLTVVNAHNISYERFCEQYDLLKSEVYVVFNDNDKEKIIAYGSVLIEPKLIRELGFVAHIEDVVVTQSVRGLGIGKMLINHLVDVAKEKGCYKVILNCNDNNCQFYEKCGFNKKEVEMVLYF